MASPTPATIQAQISIVVDMLEEVKEFGGYSAKNILAFYDAMVQAQDGDYAPESLDGAGAFRSSYSALMGSATVRGLIDSYLLDYGKAIGTPVTDTFAIIAAIAEHMRANGQTVLSRQITFGPVNADPGNVGTGTIYRFGIDEWGYGIENVTIEAKRARCIADANSGALRHEERFRLEGNTANRDLLRIEGSGKAIDLSALSARASSQFIQNQSFHSFAGALGAVTEIYGWTPLGSVGNFDIDQTNYYRTYQGETPPGALLVRANDSIEQQLRSAIQPGVPIFAQVAYNAEINGATGSIEFSVGTQTTGPISFTGQTGWQTIRLPFDKGLWFANWNTDRPKVTIAVTGKGGGDLIVDDVVLSYWTPFDGSWYVIMGGDKDNPFLLDDAFDWTDTEVGSKIQTWFWRGYGAYLPHDLTPTWTDPT